VRILRPVLTITFVLGTLAALSSQSTSPKPGYVNVGSGDKSAVRTRLLSTVPASLQQKWRKYGQWDYKQSGFEYRDFTQFNFGATGSAAKFDKDYLLALAQAFKPNESDIHGLIDPQLQPTFRQNGDKVEKLLKMANEDSQLTRVAPDFTWLINDNKWPREDIGISSARWDEYRTLFKSLELEEGVVRTKDFPGAVFLIARANGLCTGGSSAGYVYSTSSFAPISTSPSQALAAEARGSPGKHYAYVFVPLKSDWYIFYEVDW
jgi:hypothetical protein